MLKQELGGVIDQLELSELRKGCLRARWFDAVLWMDGKAKQAQRAYYALRLLIIIGGLIIPALVSLDLGSNLAAGLVHWTTFGLSLLVASAPRSRASSATVNVGGPTARSSSA